MKTSPKIRVLLFTTHWLEFSHVANLVSGTSEKYSFPLPLNGLGNNQRFNYKERMRKEVRKPLTAFTSDIYWLLGGGQRNTITNKHIKKRGKPHSQLKKRNIKCDSESLLFAYKIAENLDV